MARASGRRWLWAGAGLVVCAMAVGWAFENYAAARAAVADVRMKQMQLSALQAQLAAAKARASKTSPSTGPVRATTPKTPDEPGLLDFLSSVAATSHTTLVQVMLSENDEAHSVHVTMQTSSSSEADVQGFLHGLEYGSRLLNPAALQVSVQNRTWSLSTEWDAPFGP